MLRFITNLCGWSFAGVVLTVLSSWVCAVTLTPRSSASTPVIVQGDHYRVETTHHEQFGLMWWFVYVEASASESPSGTDFKDVPKWTLLDRLSPEQASGQVRVVMRTAMATGLPLPCLAMEVHRLYADVVQWFPSPPQPHADGIPTPLRWPSKNSPVALTDPRRLPLRPLWGGLAVNAIFWAVVAFGIARLARALRERARSRRGLCRRCAHPLANLAQCPECGAQAVRIQDHPGAHRFLNAKRELATLLDTEHGENARQE